MKRWLANKNKDLISKKKQNKSKSKNQREVEVKKSQDNTFAFK